MTTKGKQMKGSKSTFILFFGKKTRQGYHGPDLKLLSNITMLNLVINKTVTDPTILP